jgi:hypothetical protein
MRYRMGGQRRRVRGSWEIGGNQKLGEMAVEGDGEETNFGRAL